MIPQKFLCTDPDSRIVGPFEIRDYRRGKKQKQKQKHGKVVVVLTYYSLQVYERIGVGGEELWLGIWLWHGVRTEPATCERAKTLGIPTSWDSIINLVY
jgi:hypothetical protein